MMKENETNLYTKQFLHGRKLKNLGFDYHEEDTIYPCRREELNGTHGTGEKIFTTMWRDLMNDFQGLKSEYENNF